MHVVAIDQVLGSTGSSQFIIDWREDVPVTLRFLIEERVRLQWDNRENDTLREANSVSDHSASPAQEPSFYQSPIADPARRSCPKTIGEAIAEALQSFDTNGFFVIVDGQQVCDLDTMLRLGPKSEVKFLRLVPLVGG
jgi:hypothetical protein